MGCTYTESTKIKNYSNIIQNIEEEGWHLEHVNYVSRITGSESTNKVMFTGKKETVTSEIIGIYIFRAVDVP